jgi:hypothetical protein
VGKRIPGLATAVLCGKVVVWSGGLSVAVDCCCVTVTSGGRCVVVTGGCVTTTVVGGRVVVGCCCVVLDGRCVVLDGCCVVLGGGGGGRVVVDLGGRISEVESPACHTRTSQKCPSNMQEPEHIPPTYTSLTRL